MARDYSTFFAICKEHGLDYRHQVAEFTQDRTESLRSLTDQEYEELEARMKNLSKPARSRFIPPPGDEQRKKIIAIARKMRWMKDGKVDIARINAWCLKQKFKTGLNKLTIPQLNVLVTIFENNVYVSYLKGLNR